MQHFLVGPNEFLQESVISAVKSDVKPSQILYPKTALEHLQFQRTATIGNLLLVTTITRKDQFEEYPWHEKFPHESIWLVEKEDHLPKVKMPNGKLYACQELNELKFIRFVSSTLSDAGLKLPETAVHEIVNRLDPKDLYYTHSEIQKFVALVKYRETVTSQDIRTVGGDKKKTIFDLIDAFLLRRDDLGKILMGLEQQGEIPLVILTMLFDTVEKAILLKSMKSKGGGLESFIEATKTHPFQAKKLDGAILNLSADTLVAWHDRLCSIDIALKYSGQNEYTTLRAFFLEQELPNHV